MQIRTWDMDRMAEYGIAAHWKYKAGITNGSGDKLDERLAWVRQLLESQRSSADATDLLSDIKSDLLPEEVFAFTRGATSSTCRPVPRRSTLPTPFIPPLATA